MEEDSYRKMKFRATFGIVFLFILFVSYLIYVRYTNMGLHSIEVFKFVLLLDLCVVFFAVSYFRFNKIINPISVFLIFVILFIYSTLPLSNDMKFTPKLFLLIISGIFFYFLGVFISYRRSIISFPVFDDNTKLLLFRVLAALSIGSFIVEVLIIGYIPIFQIFNNKNIYGDATESMTILHTFVLLSPIIIFWSLILHRMNILNKRERNFFLIIFILIFMNNFGRTSLLMFFITGLIYFEYYGKLNNRKLLMGISGFLFLFILMGNLRSGNTGETINRILRNIANTEYETSMLESYLISYSSVNFYKINDIIEKKDQLADYSYGANAIKPLLKLTGKSPKILTDNLLFDSQGRLTTFLVDPYIDFGLLGVVLFSLLYGIVATIIFKKYSQQVNPEYIISWGLIVFCLSMGFFYNAFNTMLVWVIYISNKIILKR